MGKTVRIALMVLGTLVLALGAHACCCGGDFTRGLQQGFCQSYPQSFKTSCVNSCVARSGETGRAQCETGCDQALQQDPTYRAQCGGGAASSGTVPSTR